MTAAITTSLALIIGLSSTHDPKRYIVGTLMVLAIADNLTDSLGIHIYRESQKQDDESKSMTNTLTNFLTRLAITATFAAFVLLLPINYAIGACVVLGVIILTALSYYIAINLNESPLFSIAHHLGITTIVISVSYFLGQVISSLLNI